MIFRIVADCRFQGDSFSPRLAERKTGLTFVKKNERGEIGRIGRHVGTPIPYGSCSLRAPSEAKTSSVYAGLDWLLDTLDEEKLRLILECGAVDPVLFLGVFYDGQCNFEFNQVQLTKIAKLNVALAISCYEVRPDDEPSLQNDKGV